MMISRTPRMFVVLSLMALSLCCNASAVKTAGEEQSAIAAELQNAHKVILGLPNQRFVAVFGSARIEDGPIHRDVERLGFLLA